MIRDKAVKIESQEQFDKEMKQASFLFAKKETDETWELFAVALKNIAQWTLQDNVHQYDSFVGHIKALQFPIIRALKTERTRLSGSATDMLREISQVMQRDYEALHTLFSPTLIEMFGRTNKLLLKRAVECYKTAIENSKLPKLIPRLCTILRSGKEPNNSVRQYVAECVTKMIQVNTNDDVLRFKTHIEGAIVTAAMDKSKEVRQSVKQCYQAYCEKLPNEATRFNASLRPDAKKYLQAPSRPIPAKRALTLTHPSGPSRPVRASMPSLPTPAAHRTRALDYTRPKPRPSLPATSLSKRSSTTSASSRLETRTPTVVKKSSIAPITRADTPLESTLTQETGSLSPMTSPEKESLKKDVLDESAKDTPEVNAALSEIASMPSSTAVSPLPTSPLPEPTPTSASGQTEPVACTTLSSSSKQENSQASNSEDSFPTKTPPPSEDEKVSTAPAPKPTTPSQKAVQPLRSASSLGRNFKYFSRFNHLKPSAVTRLPKVNKPCMLSGSPVRPIKRKHNPSGEENVRPTEDERRKRRAFRT